MDGKSSAVVRNERGSPMRASSATASYTICRLRRGFQPKPQTWPERLSINPRFTFKYSPAELQVMGTSDVQIGVDSLEQPSRIVDCAGAVVTGADYRALGIVRSLGRRG